MYFKTRILAIIILLSHIVYAQNETDGIIKNGLIFSEVCLNNVAPNTNWLEVFNPTDKALTLARFRLSHVKTINMLPDSIQKKGGIVIKPGDYLLIAATKNINELFGKKLIVLSGLANLLKGGFFALSTQNLSEADIDILRYGNPSKSEKVLSFAGKSVVGYSKDGYSISRYFEKYGSGVKIFGLFESIQTPGSTNKKKP